MQTGLRTGCQYGSVRWERSSATVDAVKTPKYACSRAGWAGGHARRTAARARGAHTCTNALRISPSVILRACQTSHDCPSTSAPNSRTITCATCAAHARSQVRAPRPTPRGLAGGNHLGLCVGVVA